MLLLLVGVTLVWALVAAVFVAACVMAARADRRVPGTAGPAVLRRTVIRVAGARHGGNAARRHTGSLV